jgi:hypothetical protein
MSETPPQLTLPGLQRLLDALAKDSCITLAISDYRRLFSVNDLAQARMRNFASGHGWVAEATPTSLSFRKVR